MNDTALKPNLLAPRERREYILEVCSSLLGLIDEEIAEHRGAELIKLIGVKGKVGLLQKTAGSCRTNADFDRVEAELTLLCDDISNDLDEGNKPN